MKINTFEFFDKETKWEIEPIIFKDLTLLVGASGVGKTRILKALMKLKDIALGNPVNGVKWQITFSVKEDNYSWEGEYELKENYSFEGIIIMTDNENTRKNPIILFEKIVVNNDIIFEREGNEVKYKDNISSMPIKAEQSFFAISNDPQIEKAQKAFSKILYTDYSNTSEGTDTTDLIRPDVIKKYKNIDELRNSDESLMDKFYWVFKKNKKIFTQIKASFKTVFPQVQDIKIEPLEAFKNSFLPLFIKSSPFIQIKEEGIDTWITTESMSAGMYRTLIHVIELHLSADETVILIDEFENSLGVNCIDEVINQIKGTDHIQFIITSHHPYIINNINYKNWKIVTRKGTKVFVQDAQELGFDKSKHQAFIQLINLQEYKTGKKEI